MFSCLILQLANLAGSLAGFHELTWQQLQESYTRSCKVSWDAKAAYAIFCSFKWVMRPNQIQEVGKQLLFPGGNSWKRICDIKGGQRRQWHPTPVLLPGKSHGWRSLEGCSPRSRWGSDTTERLHFHFSLSCIGEGNGNPLQCSCLENPRDWGAWWAAVYGVAQSRPRLKQQQQQQTVFADQLSHWTWKQRNNDSWLIPVKVYY